MVKKAKGRTNVDTKISVLLTEYNTLRTEIMQRGTVLVSVFGVGVTALAFLILQLVEKWRASGFQFYFFCVLASLTLSLCAAHIIQSHVMTGKLAQRLRSLETEINGLAGCRLLCWETDFGWGGNLYKTRVGTLKL